MHNISIDQNVSLSFQVKTVSSLVVCSLRQWVHVTRSLPSLSLRKLCSNFTANQLAFELKVDYETIRISLMITDTETKSMDWLWILLARNLRVIAFFCRDSIHRWTDRQTSLSMLSPCFAKAMRSKQNGLTHFKIINIHTTQRIKMETMKITCTSLMFIRNAIEVI